MKNRELMSASEVRALLGQYIREDARPVSQRTLDSYIKLGIVPEPTFRVGTPTPAPAQKQGGPRRWATDTVKKSVLSWANGVDLMKV